MNENRFFWDSHWLEILSNHFYPSKGPNGGSVAMDSEGYECESPVWLELGALTKSGEALGVRSFYTLFFYYLICSHAIIRAVLNGEIY